MPPRRCRTNRRDRPGASRVGVNVEHQGIVSFELAVGRADMQEHAAALADASLRCLLGCWCQLSVSAGAGAASTASARPWG